MNRFIVLVLGVMIGAILSFAVTLDSSAIKKVVGKKITYINKRTGSVKVMMCKQVK